MFWPLLFMCQAASPPSVSAREVVLSNGLRVVVSRREDAPDVSVRLTVPRGANEDPPGRSGMAHLVEHLAFGGSEHAPLDAYDRWLGEAGGESQGWTEHDTITFVSTAPARATELMLFLESDRLGWPRMDVSVLDAQRRVIEGERAETRRSLEVAHLFARVLWPASHPYGRPVIGARAELAAVSVDEARQALARTLAPGGALLVIVGPQPEDTLLAMAERWFEDVPSVYGPEVSGAAPGRGYTEATPKVTDRGPDTLWRGRPIHSFWTEGTVFPGAMALGWETVPLGHPDGELLTVVAELVHDMLLPDLVGTVTAWSGRLGGYLRVVVETAHQTSAYRKTHRVLERLSANGPTPEALERVVGRLGTQDLLRLETTAGRAGFLTECIEMYQQADCYPVRRAFREQVTPADVKAAVHRHMSPERSVLLSIRPWEAPGHPAPWLTHVSLP